MANLADLMTGLIEVFQSYSQREGDKYTLTKAELKMLLQDQLGDDLTQCNDQAAMDEIMKDLDFNKDGVIDFQEFTIVFALVTMACHEFFKECDKKPKERDQSCAKK